MPRYQFQLESLQELREADRTKHRERLAVVLQAQDRLAEQTEAVMKELRELTSSQRVALRSGNLDVNNLVECQRYEFVLKSQEKTLRQQAATLEEEAVRRRDALAEAEKQVRVLEKLDERRREEFQQAEARKEENRLNEVAAQRHLRQIARQSP